MIQSSSECFERIDPEADCGLLGKGGSQFECGSPHGKEQHHLLATSCLSPYKRGRDLIFFLFAQQSSLQKPHLQRGVLPGEPKDTHLSL